MRGINLSNDEWQSIKAKLKECAELIDAIQKWRSGRVEDWAWGCYTLNIIASY